MAAKGEQINARGRQTNARGGHSRNFTFGWRWGVRGAEVHNALLGPGGTATKERRNKWKKERKEERQRERMEDRNVTLKGSKQARHLLGSFLELIGKQFSRRRILGPLRKVSEGGGAVPGMILTRAWRFYS